MSPSHSCSMLHALLSACTDHALPCPAPAWPADTKVHSLAMYYWLYPKHPPMRSYQFRMVRSALLANTLVCLPTGLGKTLIAAVVMYNYYRWFPQGVLPACCDG